uniref:Costars domain-containing protein n=1 Tax=Arion vulgaris TaxID=1028688 RepID=A0A0B7A0H1_9EUPU
MSYRRSGGVDDHFKGRISLWQKKSDDHMEKQLINPFSEWDGASHRPVMDKNDPDYGRPLKGSLTELRGQQASKDISNEIEDLCRVIKSLGKLQPDGTVCITFGELFIAYTRISMNLVGMLMRARKRGLLTFEGEMLYQHRDDDVVVTYFQEPQSC